MRASVPLILVFLLMAGALTGCGLKDDLYLPPDSGTQEEQDREAEDATSSRT